jgi:hypothetical protein
MAKHKRYNWIPTQLTEKEFNEFILPHLSKGTRGPSKKLRYYRLFSYIMRVLSTGMKWEDIEISKDSRGRPEIHYTRIFRSFKQRVDDGSFERLFDATVTRLNQNDLLDCRVLHGDGTTHSAKIGGDNIGYNQHKKMKGDKVVAFCCRNVNVVAPFVSAPGNRNECILLIPSLKKIKKITDKLKINIKGSMISLDSIYNSKSNRKAIFNRNMVPNIKLRKCDSDRKGRKQMYSETIFNERFQTIERLFAWEDKFKRVLQRFEFISAHFYAFKMLAYSMINLRHFVAAT